MNFSDQLAEFYEQLAHLMKARLPLPETLRHLAGEISSPAIRKAAKAVAEDCAAGVSFGAALDKHPGVFSAFHRRLICAGESADHLPEVLSSLGRLARFQRALNERMFAVFSYPALGLLLTLVIGSCLARWVFPDVMELQADVGIKSFAFEPEVERSRQFALELMELWRRAAPWILTLCGLAFAFFIFVSLPFRVSGHLLFKTAMQFPGIPRVVRSLEHARFTALAATLLRHGSPFDQVCETTSQLVSDRKMGKALAQVAEEARKGTSPSEALSQQPVLDPLVAALFSPAAQRDIPTELEALSGLYEERSQAGLEATSRAWTVFAFGSFYLAAFFFLRMVFNQLSYFMHPLGF